MSARAYAERPLDLRATGDRIEKLVEQVQSLAEPVGRARVNELLQLMSQLYGAGLARVLELAASEAPELQGRLAEDDLVASLLVVHGIHPDDLAARVERALDEVRPLLAAHAGGVELLEVDPTRGAVRLALTGSCDGCPSSAVTLQQAVERAIVDAAPEVATIAVDQPAPPPRPQPSIPVALGARPALGPECPADLARR